MLGSHFAVMTDSETRKQTDNMKTIPAPLMQLLISPTKGLITPVVHVICGQADEACFSPFICAAISDSLLSYSALRVLSAELKFPFLTL